MPAVDGRLSSAGKTRDGRACDRDVLFDTSGARSDSADNHPIELDGNSGALENAIDFRSSKWNNIEQRF